VAPSAVRGRISARAGSVSAVTGLALVMSSCAGTRSTPEPVRSDLHADSSVLELVAPPTGEGTLSAFGVWQGWSMGWEYNHRLNRTGTLVEQMPCQASAPPLACQTRVTMMAASGSGADEAELEAYFALVAARGVEAVSGAREVVLQGLEGERLRATRVLELPVRPNLALAPEHVVLLAGFDLASLGSADKLKELDVSLAPPSFQSQAEGIRARVPIQVEAIFGCSSMECPPKDRVDVSLIVGVTLLGARSEALDTADLDVGVEYAWGKRIELPTDAGRVVVRDDEAARASSVIGIRGFSIRGEGEMHILDFGLGISEPKPSDGGPPHAWLILRNWQRQMRGARPPMSWFAYRRPGRVRWLVDFVRLDFAAATVAHRIWKTRLDWRAEGKTALDPEAEQARMIEWEVTP